MVEQSRRLHGEAVIEQAKEWFREQPLGFVDIGARGGVHPLVEPIADVVSVLGFEPDKQACALLNATHGPWAKALCLPLALAHENGAATLYRCAAPTNDSLRPIRQKFIDRYKMVKFAQTGTTMVQAQTLDTALKGYPQQGEFLKLDTQGTEYEVLMGAWHTLDNCTAAIYCEVEFAQIYKGQRLFGDVEDFLRGHAFSFIGFDNMSYRSRTPGVGRERLLHADALFIKDPLEITITKRQAQVACMACLLCGYDDLAKEIMETL